MGDCGTDTDNLMANNTRRSSEVGEGGAAEKRQKKEEESGSGLMSQFISKIVSISGGTEGGEVEVEGPKKCSTTTVADKKEEIAAGDGYSEGGGVKSDDLITDLVNSPRINNTPLDVEVYEPQEIQIEVDVNETAGQSSKLDVGGAENGAGGGSRNGGGKGGAISDFVATLPHSISETGAPESDEASIIIHSVVHD